MLNKIIDFSVRNKLIIGLFIITLIGFGSYQFTQLPIDAVPDITNNQVQVITLAPALGATDIERLVTFPVEQANNNIPGLTEIRSFSRFGLSLVTIVFNDDVDIYWARQQVTERIQKVQTELPPGMGQISLGPVSTGLGEIYQYVVKAKKGYEKRYGPMELRTIQDWIVRRQLLGVKGVADVSSFGGDLKQYEIAIQPSRLNAQKLSMSDVFSALENNNQNTGGAYIEKGESVLYIRSEGLLTSLNDIRNINIKNLENGAPLRIGDIADVRFGNATRYGALTYNNEGEVSGAVVLMLKGENSNVVIKRVKEKVAQIASMLPEGVEIEAFLDRTKMVNNAIHTVETNLMEGALIVVFVLVLFLGNVRAGLLVASVIPLAMLFAIIMMNLFGVSGNLMSLGALDFGLIVDGAVIIVEAVMHHIAGHGKARGLVRVPATEMDHTVKESAGRMMNSAVFGQIIILVVYLPIFALQGIEGKMFRPMAQTVTFALLGAFILSLTYIPMMSALLLGKIRMGAGLSDRMMLRLERWHQRVLEKVMRIPKTIIATVLLLFVLAVGVLLSLGGEFIPSLEEGDFAVETRVLNGSSLKTTIGSTSQAARILMDRFPEVERVVTKIGTSEIPTDPMPMNAGDMIINLKPKKEWTSASSFNEMAEKMTNELREVPGITLSFQFPVQMRFNELMTGAKQDVVCKIFGENMDTLAAFAGRLGSIAATVKGTCDLYVEPVTGLPQIVIHYKRAALAQYGLNIAGLNRVVNTGLAGQSAGLVYEGEKRFDLVVRLNNERRKNIDDVANLLIPVQGGRQIPLHEVADVELKESPSQIQREDTKRRIIVGFNVRGRDVESIVKELQQKVNSSMLFPKGYYVTYGGAFENLNAAKKRLGFAVPVSLLLIFLLLYFSFHSVKQGLLIYSAIPLSAIGGIFALALRGMPFSISAGVGFIALFGVAVLNGIVLIAEFNRLKKEGVDNVRDIVTRGTQARLRPVLMTAFVASLGFLPMALSNGAGAEVQRPLATVVIGGLLIATFLTLFVLPILYMVFESGMLSKKSTAALSIMFIVLCVPQFTKAQSQSITLQAAIDTALKNNLSVKNERLKAEYLKQLSHSAYNLPRTLMSGEYGQINSIYHDNRFSIGQSFSFPTVYAHQKTVLNEEWKAGVLATAVKEAELKRDVSRLYASLQYLLQKQRLLSKTDSLYADLSEKAELRFSKGESNISEQATAKLQRGDIMVQMNQLKRDLELLELQFQLLLNTTTRYAPGSIAFDAQQPSVDTSFVPAAHPRMQLLEQEKQLAYFSTKLERSKLLPELSLLYSNMTMRGTGADNHLYGSSTRFQSGQVGIGIPLFFGAQKAKIGAAKWGLKIAENNYQAGLQNMRSDYLAALATYKTNLQADAYFKTNVLANALLIEQTANRQYAGGAINYFEWLVLINQAINSQNKAIDNNHALNESLIQLNYLLSK